MDQSTLGHRWVGWLVVAALGWLIPEIAGAATGETNKLQLLVNDTAVQLQLSYRQHPVERARRIEQLAATVAAWRAAPRSDANNEQLANWLRAAIVSSMPGSQESLPAVPTFAAVIKTQPRPELHKASAPQAVEESIVKKTPVEAIAKPENDPFRDDP